jgi:hypothetical protein
MPCRVVGTKPAILAMIEPMPEEAEDKRNPDGGPDSAHLRHPGTSDETVEALGKLSEALEVVEQARGLLYGFHRLTGTADLMLDEAVSLLRVAGHADLAGRVEGRSSAATSSTAGGLSRSSRTTTTTTTPPSRTWSGRPGTNSPGGKRHLFEAGMKERRRSGGRPHHEALPTAEDDR